MKKQKITITALCLVLVLVLVLALALALGSPFSPAYGAEDEYGEHSHEYHMLSYESEGDGHSGEHHEEGERNLELVYSPLYSRECGACHFAYQPGLLPAGSWTKIVSGLKDHFGQDASLDEKSAGEISRYLTENAAEHSAAKRSLKILRSLDGATPVRITETPYIRKKHDELSATIYQRESIRSFSNCQACHTTAERGIYSERYIHIPR